MRIPLTNRVRKGIVSAAYVVTAILLPLQTVLAISAADLQSILTQSELYNASCSDSNTTTAGIPLSGSGAPQEVFNYFVLKGLTPTQAAGIVGNFQQESGVNSADGGGGLAQWGGSRFTALEAFAASEGKTWTDLGASLDFTWHELTTDYKPVLTSLQATTTIPDATSVFTGPDDISGHPVAPTDEVQRSGGYEDPGTPDMSNRIGYAQTALTQFGGAAPVTAAGAEATIAASGTGSGGTGCGGCLQPPVPGASTIVLDPGHSPDTDPSQRDPQTGLYVQDYENDPEMANAYTAATKIESRLQAKGYTVVMIKSSATDKLDLGTRASRANAANGALVVTLHSTPGISGMLMYPDSNSHREPHGAPRTDGTNGLVHPGIEAPSQKDASTMAPIISQGIGNSGYVAKSFYQEYGTNGLLGNGLNTGNTPVETILMNTPEVYSEVDQSVLPTDKFADAMTKAITTVVPPPSPSADVTGPASSVSSSCSTSGTIQAAIQLAMRYSWSDGRHTLTMKPSYQAATQTAQAAGEYVGGNADPGIDCGGFITRVMRNSGADPNYNWGPNNPKQGPTTAQQAYLDANSGPGGKYTKLGTFSTLDPSIPPGAIAINSEHTFMYVGPESAHTDFKGNAAMASLDGYAPTASNAYFSNSAGAFTWYVLN